jgi:hypothetical protein
MPKHAPGNSFWTLTGGVLLLTIGCANPCAREGARVETALTHARGERADLYAPQPLGQASAMLDQAKEECARQSSRFVLFRSYRPAEALFAGALQKAETALAQSRTGQALAKQEALNARYEAGMAVNDALVALRRAYEMKHDPIAQALVGRLNGLRLALGDLQKRINAGEYLPARDLGVKIRDESVRLEADANRGALAAPSR